MEFTSEILQAISKRAWKLSWILVAYSILCLSIILYIFIEGTSNNQLSRTLF